MLDRANAFIVLAGRSALMLPSVHMHQDSDHVSSWIECL